jgi:hypothetical protein
MRWPRPPEFECTVVNSDAIGAPVAGRYVGPRLEQAKFGIPACDVAGRMTPRRRPRAHNRRSGHDGTKLSGSCLWAPPICSAAVATIIALLPSGSESAGRSDTD